MVVHWVLTHFTVKFFPRKLFVEQRHIEVIEHYTVFIKGKYLILRSTDIYAVSEMILILCYRFLCRFLRFGRGGREYLTVSLLFFNLGSAFFLLFKPLRIFLLFLWVQVSAYSDKFSDTLFNLRPRKSNVGIVFTDTLCNRDTFSVVVFVNTRTDNYRIRATPTVFVFQKVGIFLCGKALFKLLIDTHFTLGNSASTGQHCVDNLLRKSKGRGFLFLCLTV